MAIEYQLKFADGVDPSTLAAGLRMAGFADTDSPVTFTAPGLAATIGGARDIDGRWAAVGFAPHVEVLFVQDKFADHDAAIGRLVDTVALLLRQVPVDAVMAANDEVVLTNRNDWWIRPAFTPKLADRMDDAYRLEPLPIV